MNLTPFLCSSDPIVKKVYLFSVIMVVYTPVPFHSRAHMCAINASSEASFIVMYLERSENPRFILSNTNRLIFDQFTNQTIDC